MSRREEFLRRFLAVCGAGRIQVNADGPAEIVADAWWPNESSAAKLTWQVAEDQVPPGEADAILDYLERHGLVDIDMISAPRRELFHRMQVEKERHWSFEQFEAYLEALLTVEVPYVQDGRRDSLCLHE